MNDRGRHSRGSGPAFYKDILFLIAGILIVGAMVFGGLSLWAGRNDGTPAPGSDQTAVADATTTTTIVAPSSTIGSTLATTPDESAVSSTTSSTTDTAAPVTTLREVRPPADVRVVVLNSIGATGLAGDLTAEFGQAGYQTAEPDNYTPELSDTMIFHAEGFALEALEVAELVPDGTVAADTEMTAAQGVDVVVVIGLSYQE